MASAPAILAEGVLAAHVAVILFNVFGLIVVPIGAVRGWRFVHIAWWRVLHVVLLAAVAAQALANRACFLTIWQSDLAGSPASPTPLIESLVDRLIYWKLPIWIFAALYTVVFVYAVALLWLVPVRWTRQQKSTQDLLT
jgi:Protein of Unknown function (DUF2784)